MSKCILRALNWAYAGLLAPTAPEQKSFTSYHAITLNGSLGFIHILWHCVQSEEMMVCCLLWKNTIYWNLQWNQDMVEDDVYLLFDHCISVWSAACTHSIIAFIRGTFLRLASSSWHPCLYYWWCDVCILRLGASTDLETMATLSFSVYFFLHKKVSNLWAKTFMQAA